mmetsp:Transcript_70601/g.216335  ORF Transcript_70601/g.216335 Transcript_70601/m.216335 type:complete len:259 (-) Transcript_70601:637-1413(-)
MLDTREPTRSPIVSQSISSRGALARQPPSAEPFAYSINSWTNNVTAMFATTNHGVASTSSRNASGARKTSEAEQSATALYVWTCAFDKGSCKSLVTPVTNHVMAGPRHKAVVVKSARTPWTAATNPTPVIPIPSIPTGCTQRNPIAVGRDRRIAWRSMGTSSTSRRPSLRATAYVLPRRTTARAWGSDANSAPCRARGNKKEHTMIIMWKPSYRLTMYSRQTGTSQARFLSGRYSVTTKKATFVTVSHKAFIHMKPRT